MNISEGYGSDWVAFIAGAVDVDEQDLFGEYYIDATLVKMWYNNFIGINLDYGILNYTPLARDIEESYKEVLSWYVLNSPGKYVRLRNCARKESNLLRRDESLRLKMIEEAKKHKYWLLLASLTNEKEQLEYNIVNHGIHPAFLYPSVFATSRKRKKKMDVIGVISLSKIVHGTDCAVAWCRYFGLERICDAMSGQNAQDLTYLPDLHDLLYEAFGDDIYICMKNIVETESEEKWTAMFNFINRASHASIKTNDASVSLYRAVRSRGMTKICPYHVNIPCTIAYEISSDKLSHDQYTPILENALMTGMDPPDVLVGARERIMQSNSPKSFVGCNAHKDVSCGTAVAKAGPENQWSLNFEDSIELYACPLHVNVTRHLVTRSALVYGRIPRGKWGDHRDLNFMYLGAESGGLVEYHNSDYMAQIMSQEVQNMSMSERVKFIDSFITSMSDGLPIFQVKPKFLLNGVKKFVEIIDSEAGKYDVSPSK